MTDRRRNRPARTREEILQQLPARLLIDRLSTPMLAIGLDGVVVYATAACEQLLGYRNGTRLTGQSLPELLVDHSDTTPEDCITLLRVPKTIVKWQHTDGYPVSTVVSSTILLRATDPLMMVSLTDVTEWTWAGASPRD
jgi:PAS domain-containing protein